MSSGKGTRGSFRARAVRARDRVVAMDDSVIVGQRPAKQLIENPTEELTKRFLELVLEH
jgi:ABC-type polar amino acid transport system ATPase subunit